MAHARDALKRICEDGWLLPPVPQAVVMVQLRLMWVSWGLGGGPLGAESKRRHQSWQQPVPSLLVMQPFEAARFYEGSRRSNGLTRAPLCREKRVEARQLNVLGGGSMGACVGGLIGGPPLALLCGFLGAAMGWDADSK